MPLLDFGGRFEDASYVPFSGQELVQWWRDLEIEDRTAGKAIRDILDETYVKDIPGNMNKEIANDPTIRVAFFKEAVDYFAKGMLTFYSSHTLLRDNHRSWALIATYYSSFYTINSLLRIQGRAIVHSTKKNQDLFWLCPSVGSPGNFLVKNRREGRGEHNHHWKYFYRLYRGFSPSSEDYEPILFEEYFGSEEREESAIRNDRTYRPFSFEETSEDWTETAEEFWDTLGTSDTGLRRKIVALCTDPAHKYFARSALRLILARELLETVTTRTPLQDSVRSTTLHLRSMTRLMVPSNNLRQEGLAWALSRQFPE